MSLPPCYRCGCQPCECADGITLYHADCRDVLPLLEEGMVDLVLTDPPWKATATNERIPGQGVAKNYESRGTLPYGIIGVFDAAIIRACELLASDTLVICGFKELGEVIGSLCGYRGTFVWHKPNGSPAIRWPAKLDVAFIVWGANKSKLIGYQHWASSVFSYAMPTAGCITNGERVLERGSKKAAHPAQGPLRLYHELLRPTNGLVLDPYGGTGTTGRACKDLGRKCIMVEIEERYCEIAANRLRQEVLF